MKQIIVIFGLIALSAVGHHMNPEFKAVKAKACDTTAKITESQWTALVACGRNNTNVNQRMADFHAAVYANCSSAANETDIQTLKITGNDEQIKAVNEMCSHNYLKCKMNYMNSSHKNHKKGDHKRKDGDGGGDDEHKKKREQFKEKMGKMASCMKTAVGITA